MLDAHPDLSIPPETHFLPLLFRLSVDGPDLREAFVQRVIHSRRWRDFGIPESLFRCRVAEPRRFTVPGGIRAFYESYAELKGKKRWGDKTPAYATYIAEIGRYLPEAHFIHLIRDGRDVAVSNRDTWWGVSTDLLDWAHVWVKTVQETRRQSQACSYYLEVRYEELVNNTTAVLDKVCRFLDLPYREEMESYHRTAQQRMDELQELLDRAGNVAATRRERIEIHHLTEAPPDATRIGRWRRELSSAEIREFACVAGPLLRELGYEES
jgi:hypothetical protein